MAYAHLTATYDITLKNSVVTITEKFTGVPATILDSVGGGIKSLQGVDKLDDQARLDVIVDTSKQWNVKILDGQTLPYNVYDPKQIVTLAELNTLVPKIGVTYVLNQPPYTEYKWDGHNLVGDLTAKQMNTVKGLSDSSIDHMNFNGQGKLSSYISQGVQHTITYPNANTIVFSNETGVVKTVNLDNSGNVVSIT